MIPIDFSKLIYSITYYLSYQDRIGRSFMIDESSLKYPVVEYLTGLEIQANEIQLEFDHYCLKKRQIDLVTIKPSLGKIDYAFEFKIAHPYTVYEPEQKRIFHDLMRLNLLSNSDKSKSYFVIAGKQDLFIQSFRSIPESRPTTNKNNLPDPEGFYTEWFDFKLNGSKTFDVKNTTKGNYQSVYKSFIDTYKPKDPAKPLELPETITTTCLAISAISRTFPTLYVGGIWKIE
jgi:hypothetical protein